MGRTKLRTPRTLRRFALAHHQRWLFSVRAGDVPGLAIPRDEVARIRRRLLRTPKALNRLVCVIAGYADPGAYAWIVARELRRLTSHDKRDFFVPRFRLDGPIERMSAAVQEQLAARAQSGHTEFDLVGLSMGGLISRHVAATYAANDRVVRIKRVFTLGTPHQGATLADKLAPSEAARQMKPGSDFLRDLDAAFGTRPLDLTCYQMNGDTVIGQDHGSPAGHPSIRLPRRPGEPHLHVMADPLAILDIALRLRGEPPVLTPQEAQDSSQ